MSENSKYKVDLAFLDMLFNMMLVFAMLFMLSFILIKENDSKPAPERKAEFIIEMSWPDEAFDDIDLHILMPNGKQVNFRNRDVEYILLDRDDRGAHGDMIFNGEGQMEVIKTNREVASIRAIVPGKYVVNIHAYRFYNHLVELKSDVSPPYPVKIVLTKINPTISEVTKVEKIIETPGQQVTAFSFEVTEDGTVVELNKEDDIPFIQIFKPLDFSVGEDNGTR